MSDVCEWRKSKKIGNSEIGDGWIDTSCGATLDADILNYDPIYCLHCGKKIKDIGEVCEWIFLKIAKNGFNKIEPNCRKGITSWHHTIPNICPFCHKKIRVIEEEKDG